MNCAAVIHFCVYYEYHNCWDILNNFKAARCWGQFLVQVFIAAHWTLLTHCSVTSTCLFIISCQITTLQCVEGRCGSSAVAGGDSLYSIQIWNNKIAFQIFNFFWHWHFCDIWLLSSKMLGWRIYFQFLFRYLLHHSLKEVSIWQTELECSELNQNVYMHLVSLKTNKFSPTQSRYLILHSMIFSARCVLVTLGSCLRLCVVYVGWALPNSL